jgi:hypothetical protein
MLGKYNIFIHIIRTLAIVALGSGCHELDNRVDRLELECGTWDFQPEVYSYVKLMTDKGPAVPLVSVSDIKAQLVDLEARSPALNIPISDKGCAVLPKERLHQTRLDVRVQNSNLAGVTLISGTSIDAIETLYLRPSSVGTYSLLCPQEGIFASQSFTNPLLVTDAGSPETNQLTLVAQPMNADAPPTPLFRKNFGYGLDSASFGAEISTQNLQEGVYYLRGITSSLAENFGLLPRYINDEKACTLTVMKTAPVIESDLFLTKGFFVGKKNQTLPLAPRPDVSAIKYCRQPYQSRAAAFASCQQLARQCKAAGDFEPLTDEATSQTGLYDYFFYAWDRAGNQSDLQCQSIAIIDRPPAFSVTWPHEAWEIPNAFMKDAALTIKPIITISDEQTLPSTQIEQGLQCRIEFVSHEGVKIQGSDVICTGGICRGKSLEDFIPCDRNFAMSLAKVWSNSYVNNSTLKLIIQANVGAESPVTLAKTINIQSKRWNLQKLQTPGDNWDQTIKLDDQSLLVSFREKGVYKWQDETWTQISPPDVAAETLKNSKILQDSNGNIYGIFEGQTDSSQAFRLNTYRYESDAWTPLAEQPPFADCKLVTSRPDGGFTCLSSNADLLSYDGKNWNMEAAGPEGIKESLKRSMAYWGQTLYVVTNWALYVRNSNAGSWETVYSVPQNDTTNIMEVQEFDGALWVYLSDRLKVRLIRVSGSGPFEVNPVPAPEIKTASLNQLRAFSLNEAGQLYFFSYKWDKGQQSWEKMNSLPENMPGSDPKLEQDLNGRFWIKTPVGFLSTDQGQFYSTANEGVDPSKPLMINERGDFYFLGIPAQAEFLQLYKVSRKNYFILNQSTSRFSLETFPDAWINHEGIIHAVSFRKGEVLALENSSWKTIDKFPANTESEFYEKSMPLKDGGLLIKTGAGLLIKRPHSSWNYLFKRGDSLQKLLTQAKPDETITVDTLKRITLVGEMPDGTIILGIAESINTVLLSDIAAIKADGQVLSKTSKALTKLEVVQNAVITKDGILLTGKLIPDGSSQQRTLFVLLDSNLESLRKSTVVESDQYLALMADLAPQYPREGFLAGFALQASGRSAVCSYRSKVDDLSAGRFICLELITSPSISFGKPIATPSEAQLKRVRKVYPKHEPTRFPQLLEGKTSSIFFYSSEIFTTPALSENSVWETRASREQIVGDVGTEALVQSTYQDAMDRFVLGIRGAGILVFD